jgi:hypothetical protein
MLALFGPLAFNIRTPRREVSVLRFQGHRRTKHEVQNRRGRYAAPSDAQDTYAAPSYLSGWSPALPWATISFSEKALRRASEGSQNRRAEVPISACS